VANLLDALPQEEGGSDDAVKVIDTLRIGIPLYNVYLNEADEWSRRLVTCLQEWALELHEPCLTRPWPCRTRWPAVRPR